MTDADADPAAVTYFCNRVADAADEDLNRIPREDFAALVSALEELSMSVVRALERLAVIQRKRVS